MFLAAKILAMLTQPLAWVIALLLLALVTLKRKPIAGYRLVASALILLLAIGWQPLPDAVMRHLESQYTEFQPQADLGAYAGAIILGGATESGNVAQAHVQPLLGGAAERITVALSMHQHNPHLRFIYTGGEGELLGSGPSEADRARMFYESMGPAAPTMDYESVSRNTYENAVLTAKLPGVDITQRWLLITSATHMPRSMATFRKAGWNVTAYPVDFHTGTETPWTDYSLRDGVDHWQLALHEWLGIAAYRLTGRL